MSSESFLDCDTLANPSQPKSWFQRWREDRYIKQELLTWAEGYDYSFPKKLDLQYQDKLTNLVEYYIKINSLKQMLSFRNLLIFLAIALALGIAIYVGALAIGPLAVSLGAPVIVANLIAASILTTAILASLRFIQIHWQIYAIFCTQNKNRSKSEEGLDRHLRELIKDPAKSIPLRQYLFTLFTASFVRGESVEDALTRWWMVYVRNKAGALVLVINPLFASSQHLPDDPQCAGWIHVHGNWLTKLQYYVYKEKKEVNKAQAQIQELSVDKTAVLNLAALLAALALGSFLAVKLVPFVLAAVMAAFNLPFGLAVVFGAVVAVSLVTVTYQLLALPTRLDQLRHFLKALTNAPARECWELTVLSISSWVGIALAVGASYVFFLPLTQVLGLVLAPGLSIFLAVATTCSLAVLLAKLWTEVLGGVLTKRKPYKAVEAKSLCGGIAQNSLERSDSTSSTELVGKGAGHQLLDTSTLAEKNSTLTAGGNISLTNIRYSPFC